MDNQHRQMKGYRELTKEEIALINEVKAVAEQAGRFIERIEQVDWLLKLVAAHPGTKPDIPGELLQMFDDMRVGTVVVDMRWLAIEKTDLQKAHMCLVRAIARPSSF